MRDGLADLEQVGAQARQQRLRLRVAEAAVELDHLRAVGGEHHAGVEHAAVLAAGGGEGGNGALGHLALDPARVGVGEPAGRRVDAHAAGVGAAVAVEHRLVVAAERHVHDGRAVGEGVRRGLRAAQPLLDQHPRAGLAERACHHRRLDRLEGFGGGIADGDALAGGEAVGLDDVLAPEAAHVVHGGFRVIEGGGVPGLDAGIPHQLLRERLRELDLRPRARGAEHRDALGAQRVGDARRERRLRPDDDEVGAQPRAAATTAAPSFSSRLARFSPYCAVPAFPGALVRLPRRGDCASFQAIACSRPPPPSRRTLLLIAPPASAGRACTR